jgi:hypothetical protein
MFRSRSRHIVKFIKPQDIQQPLERIMKIHGTFDGLKGLSES